MTNSNDRNHNANGVQGDGPQRDTYEAPAILYREPLEAVAAVCSPGPPPIGPAKTSPGVCPEGPISS